MDRGHHRGHDESQRWSQASPQELRPFRYDSPRSRPRAEVSGRCSQRRSHCLHTLRGTSCTSRNRSAGRAPGFRPATARGGIEGRRRTRSDPFRTTGVVVVNSGRNDGARHIAGARSGPLLRDLAPRLRQRWPRGRQGIARHDACINRPVHWRAPPNGIGHVDPLPGDEPLPAWVAIRDLRERSAPAAQPAIWRSVGAVRSASGRAAGCWTSESAATGGAAQGKPGCRSSR